MNCLSTTTAAPCRHTVKNS